MASIWGVLVIVGIVALMVIMRGARHRQRDDHGTVTRSWLAEQRGKKPGDDH